MSPKTFKVVTVATYQNPYAPNPNVMDVHLVADDGTQAVLRGVPAICHEDEAERKALLELYKRNLFVIGLADELPLSTEPVKKTKPKKRR